MELDDQIPKHKKKKYSKSNSTKRSDHKHDYEKVILKTCLDIRWANRCRICGRFGDQKFGLVNNPDLYKKRGPIDDSLCASGLLRKSVRPLTLQELRAKFPDVQIYEDYMDYDENGKLIVELKYRLVTDKFTE